MIKDVIIHKVGKIIVMARARSLIQHTSDAQHVRNSRSNAGSSEQPTDGPSPDQIQLVTKSEQLSTAS